MIASGNYPVQNAGDGDRARISHRGDPPLQSLLHAADRRPPREARRDPLLAHRVAPALGARPARPGHRRRAGARPRSRPGLPEPPAARPQGAGAHPQRAFAERRTPPPSEPERRRPARLRVARPPERGRRRRPPRLASRGRAARHAARDGRDRGDPRRPRSGRRPVAAQAAAAGRHRLGRSIVTVASTPPNTAGTSASNRWSRGSPPISSTASTPSAKRAGSPSATASTSAASSSSRRATTAAAPSSTARRSCACCWSSRRRAASASAPASPTSASASRGPRATGASSCGPTACCWRRAASTPRPAIASSRASRTPASAIPWSAKPGSSSSPECGQSTGLPWQPRCHHCRSPPGETWRQDERFDDAAAAADLFAACSRRAAPRRAGGGVAPGRGRHPSHDVPRARGAIAADGQRPRRPRHQERRPRRDAGLERPSPHGALLRGLGIGIRAAHAQPAPAPRPGRLHRRPRRGPGAVLRSHLPASGGSDRQSRQDHQDLRRDDRPRPHAGRKQDRQPALLRGARRGEQRFVRLADLRREPGVVALLHVGDDGQPEGRPLQPSLDPAAHLRDRPSRRAQLLGQGRDPAGRADVPRQRLGPAVRRLHDGIEARLSRPRPRRQVALRAVRERARHALGRGADGVAGPARPRRCQRPQVLDHAANDHRRLGVPAGDDEHLPGEIRRAGSARVGDDRDEPGRHRRRAEGLAGRPRSAGALRAPVEAGPRRLRRRHEDRRRRGRRAAVGRRRSRAS